MPAGIPVATVALNGAMNAGILAAKILGSGDPKISEKLQKYQDGLEQKVMMTVDELKETHPNQFDA